mmetsp:Transcript_82363/g.228518  ORF Transcript_82363/g.228518 Transcript_82363/m.228518 type:complete len:344 (+) Transcript_82363:130-1161(+)
MGNPFSRGGYLSLKGHTQIAAVRFLPGGELVTAGDTSIRLWAPETGKAEKVWRLTDPVETCCCSPDGRYIACGVLDGLVFVYEVRTRQQIAHWQAHADCGQGPLLQFFADSTYLLSAAIFTCKIWSSRTTTLINTWDTTLLTSLHIAADCTLLAVGSNTGVVTIHNLPDGNATRQVHAHRGEVWAVAFSPDRSLLATASRDEPDGVKLWATESWELAQALRGHVGLVLDCAFSPDSSQLVTCGYDRTLRVWRHYGGGSGAADAGATSSADGSCLGSNPGSGGTWRCENILVGHNDAVLSCAFAPGTRGVVASGARDGSARAWRLADVPQITAAEAAAHGVPFS